MNPLKKQIVLVGFFLAVLTTAFGQGKSAAPQAPKNCYGEWFSLFRSRGGKAIPDGTQDVIISLRNGETSHCFMGKIAVSGGKLVLPLMIQKQDGSFETFASTGAKLDPTFVSTMPEDQLLAITDGMSVSFRTTDSETGRLFFYKFLEDKPKANKVAPAPGALIKN
jgi:hypothetical protein